MKTILKLTVTIGIICLLSACGTVQYRDKYAILTPNDNLLKDNDAPAPPVTSIQYSKLSCDAKESMWTLYTTDLLGVIGKEHADKAGLRTWKADAVKKTDELNAASEKQSGSK